MPDFTLALKFDTDNREFVRGAQIGQIYERLRTPGCELPVTFVTYVENAEMVLRIAETFDLAVSCMETVVDEWLEVTFS